MSTDMVNSLSRLCKCGAVANDQSDWCSHYEHCIGVFKSLNYGDLVRLENDCYQVVALVDSLKTGNNLLTFVELRSKNGMHIVTLDLEHLSKIERVRLREQS